MRTLEMFNSDVLTPDFKLVMLQNEDVEVFCITLKEEG
jgi:hypothetical protein